MPDETMSESMAVMTPEGIPEGIDEAALAAAPELEEDLEVTVVTGEEDDVVQVAAAAEEADEEEAEERGSGGARRRTPARSVTGRRPRPSRPRSLRASWPCTSATWPSWKCCAPSRSSRPLATSSSWSWSSGGMLLSHPPAAGWVADLIEKAVEQPVPDLKGYRAARGQGQGQAEPGWPGKLRQAGGRAGRHAEGDGHRPHLRRGGDDRGPPGGQGRPGRAAPGCPAALRGHQDVRPVRPGGSGQDARGEVRPRTPS